MQLLLEEQPPHLNMVEQVQALTAARIRRSFLPNSFLASLPFISALDASDFSSAALVFDDVTTDSIRLTASVSARSCSFIAFAISSTSRTFRPAPSAAAAAAFVAATAHVETAI